MSSLFLTPIWVPMRTITRSWNYYQHFRNFYIKWVNISHLVCEKFYSLFINKRSNVKQIDIGWIKQTGQIPLIQTLFVVSLTSPIFSRFEASPPIPWMFLIWAFIDLTFNTLLQTLQAILIWWETGLIISLSFSASSCLSWTDSLVIISSFVSISIGLSWICSLAITSEWSSVASSSSELDMG